jgi:hypothetical protein
MGTEFWVNEVFRPNERQMWLFGAGRTPEQCAKKGVPKHYARPKDPIVTNSWSAKNSAHGWMENGKPAACALDIVPLGKDGKPWTKDDPWDDLVKVVQSFEHIGLRHFHKPGKPPWDKPHVQLTEWSDAEHRLILPGR